MTHPSRHATSLELNLNALLAGSLEPHAFRSPQWPIGGNAQTIVSARPWRFPCIAYRRERWDTPDHDFIDLDRTTRETDAHVPFVVMFHGLEGDSRSHYARLLMDALRSRRWLGVIPHFRGRSGEMNLALHMYHCDDGAKIAWVFERLYRTVCVPQGRKLLVIGISLGGNVLPRYLGEHGIDAHYVIVAATVSTPLDIWAGGAALSKGFNMVYTRMLLRTLKAKVNAKLDRHPDLYDRATMMAMHMPGQFDNPTTVSLHGFRDVLDYWMHALSKPVLREVCVPTLVLNARNDLFLPGQYLSGVAEVLSDITLDQPLYGGHVGLLLRHGKTGRVDWMPARVLRLFDDVLVRPEQVGDAYG